MLPGMDTPLRTARRSWIFFALFAVLAASCGAQRAVPRDEPELAVGDGVVLLDFGADWCPPCRRLEPILDQVEAERAGKLEVLRIDVDEQPGAASRYGVEAIPVLVLLRDGVEVERHVGLLSKDSLLAMVDAELAR